MAFVLDDHKPAYLLNNASRISCSHGGQVVHSTHVTPSYLVDGGLPLLQCDTYRVVGCPVGCVKVTWLGGSPRVTVKGSPVLIHTSVGTCLTETGAPQGPAILISYQTAELEPDDPEEH
jgi:hypothetical protein